MTCTDVLMHDQTENRLQELDNTEQARDNIKQQLAKARDMVSRAENDWMSKQEALEKVNKSISGSSYQCH